MKAYDLMKLAAENPQKYEGKRYKATTTYKGDRFWVNGESSLIAYSDECIIRNGTLCTPYEPYYSISVNNRIEVEEIRESVSWQEAIQAWIDGKNPYSVRIDMKDCELSLSGLLEHSETIIKKAFTNGKWYIEE